MQVSEVRKVVEEWAIGKISADELAAITEEQWALFVNLLRMYLSGAECGAGWQDNIRFKMRRSGCSDLAADMFSWSRYEFGNWPVTPSDVLLGENNTRTAEETQEMLKGPIGQVLGVDHLLNQEEN